jgi:hypothetical protein
MPRKLESVPPRPQRPNRSHSSHHRALPPGGIDQPGRAAGQSARRLAAASFPATLAGAACGEAPSALAPAAKCPLRDPQHLARFLLGSAHPAHADRATLRTASAVPLAAPPPGPSPAPFLSAAKTGQITRYKNRTDHESATSHVQPLGPATRRRYARAMCGRARLSSDVSEIKLVFSIPPHRPTPVSSASQTARLT